jgi:hypothetical protein
MLGCYLSSCTRCASARLSERPTLIESDLRCSTRCVIRETLMTRLYPVRARDNLAIRLLVWPVRETHCPRRSPRDTTSRCFPKRFFQRGSRSGKKTRSVPALAFAAESSRARTNDVESTGGVQVKRFTREDLVRFYKRHYYPSNMHLFVVGDVVPTEVLAEIERLFGPEPVAPPSLVAEQGPAGEMLRRGWQTPDGPISTWPKRGSIITHDWARAPSRPFEKVQHAQLSTFSLTVTTKEHLDSNVRARHLEEELIDSLIGMALDSRATVPPARHIA